MSTGHWSDERIGKFLERIAWVKQISVSIVIIIEVIFTVLKNRCNVNAMLHLKSWVWALSLIGVPRSVFHCWPRSSKDSTIIFYCLFHILDFLFCSLFRLFSFFQDHRVYAVIRSFVVDSIVLHWSCTLLDWAFGKTWFQKLTLWSHHNVWHLWHYFSLEDVMLYDWHNEFEKSFVILRRTR